MSLFLELQVKVLDLLLSPFIQWTCCLWKPQFQSQITPANPAALAHNKSALRRPSNSMRTYPASSISKIIQHLTRSRTSKVISVIQNVQPECF